MNKTNIEYLDYTWNPIAMRCTPVSDGCKNCWHLRMANRLAGNANLKTGHAAAYAGKLPPVLNEEELIAPVKLKKPSRIGVQFMGDLFHHDVTDSMIDSIISVMTSQMSGAPQHTYVILTKRPERILKGNAERFSKWENIWLGVTCENQEQADKRIPIMLQIPAAVRFVSVEPMLGPVDIAKYLRCESCIDPSVCWCNDPRINWVIPGGETGPGARPMHPNWVRSLRDQCQAASVPFFFKSWGEYVYSVPCDVESAKAHLITKDGDPFYRVGKKSAGRLLDGRTWEEYPA